MLKKAFWSLLICILLAATSFARDVHVKGYFRKDGTYVQPHYRSAPDGNPYNNFSAKGNVNPYTGKVGTVDPDSDSYGHRKSNGGYGYQLGDIDVDPFGSHNDKKNHDDSIFEEETNEEDNN